MYTEIVKIIEGGTKGDKEKVYNYAKVLAENLEKSGDASLSNKIKKLLNNKRTRTVSLDQFSTKPVDVESRMDMVDVFIPGDDFDKPILKKYIENEIDDFINIYKRRDDILKAGVDLTNSLLLYGPPGCGKTTLAKYISFKLKIPLLTVRLDGVISSLLGSTSKNIRKIFDYASKRECVLFLDEFDVVAKMRDDKHEVGELKRVVNSLIQNIDDFNENSILVAATNHHELLDPAIWRRFSKIISLEKPNKEEIIEMILSRLKYSENDFLSKKKMGDLAKAFVGVSHADVKTVLENSIKKSILRGDKLVRNWNLLSELYLYKFHKIDNEDNFIKFLLEFGVTHREINENFGFSLRKIREMSKTLS
jgi:SpoVK/Ycf46/Vps4 family AAA+-type ATPase